jgi:hypothetical protein
MHNIFEKAGMFVKVRQQAIVLALGYLLVAVMAFGAGRISASGAGAPEIRVETAFLPPNDSVNSGLNQSGTTPNPGPGPAPLPVPGPNPVPAAQDCPAGQIKGNIGGSGSRVYHMPGGSFYNRTKAEQCFATEAEAQAAGFRKSSA